MDDQRAKEELNPFRRAPFLREVFSTCKKNGDFFVMHGMQHERKLAMEVGLKAYIEYSMLYIQKESNSECRTKEYKKVISAIKKLEEIEDDDNIKKIFTSSLLYLKGRKSVNEYIISGKSNLELIKEAKGQFKEARDVYEKANVCHCIYSGILEIESIEEIEKEADSKIEIITKIIKELSDQTDSNVIAFFEEVISILKNRNDKDKDEILSKLNGLVLKIDYYALRQILDQTRKNLSDKWDKYQKDLFRPNVDYRNFKLRITFIDPDEVKGILTIKIDEEKVFSDFLGKNKELFIDYIPKHKEVNITFEIFGAGNIISRSTECCDYIHRKGEPDLKVYILEHDCRDNIFISGNNLNIAIVQLKYDVVSDGKVINLTFNGSIKKEKVASENELENETVENKQELYGKKIRYILDAIKGRAKIVVFPEFSIPFEFLSYIQEYANRNQIIVVAGSHYVTEENLDKYKGIFEYDIRSTDLRKNICPIIIPNFKIVHTEKLLPSKMERAFLNKEGMTQGELKHILKISDKLNLGVLVCFEYLHNLRELFVEACDILLVPQTNPKTERFYQLAISDLNNPYYPGNKTFVMANGIFIYEGKISGGSSGLLLTLDMHSHKELLEKAIKKPIEGVYEQFILFASINTELNTSRDISQGQVSVISQWVPIIEETEICERVIIMMEKSRLSIREIYKEEAEKQNYEVEKINQKIKAEAREFIKLINLIIDAKTCDDVKMKAILNSVSLIKQYSPLMYEENAKDLKDLDLKEAIEKCYPIFIPNN